MGRGIFFVMTALLRNVLLGLIAFERDGGDVTAALAHAQELAVLEPQNPQIRPLIQDLRRRLER